MKTPAFLCVIFTALLAPVANAAETLPGQTPSSANPILPGYYADPAIVEHGGAFYIYATLDPWGGETLGCWESSDLKNWTFRELNWPTKAACSSPTSKSAMVWAPSVVAGPDGNFYMYVSVGSEVWAGVAPHPLGPWRNSLGDKPLIAADYETDYHMIDADVFFDDDGAAYLYWGSGWNWKNGRCFAVKLGADMRSFASAVRDVTPSHYFEAPLMTKRHGKYFLSYSDGITIEDTYQIHYAVGDSPFGPFEEAANSPILATDHEKRVVSPGHHTVFSFEGRDYLLYHRHSIPFLPDQIGRQVCVDAISFTDDGRIETVIPSHDGPDFAQGRKEAHSLAFAAPTSSSGDASEMRRSAFAVDNNYATRWAPNADAGGAWLQIDLGSARAIKQQLIRPEFAWKPYRFAIESSLDGQTWQTVSDFTRSPISGSPMVVNTVATARYLRLVFPEGSSREAASIIEWAVF